MLITKCGHKHGHKTTALQAPAFKIRFPYKLERAKMSAHPYFRTKSSLQLAKGTGSLRLLNLELLSAGYGLQHTDRSKGVRLLLLKSIVSAGLALFSLLLLISPEPLLIC